MQLPKLLIAESNDELRHTLLQLLQDSYCVRSCCSGDQALELLRTFSPDVVYIDIMLPQIDGLAVLRAAAKEGIRPAVLACVGFDSPYVTNTLLRLQVGYMVKKPCSPKVIASHIIELTGVAAQESSDRGLYDAANLLQQLGFAPHRDGYQYLLTALPMFARNPQQGITKELYPAVGKECGKAATLVERSMRSAIHSAWDNRKDSVWRQFFTPAPDGSIPRPSNAQMLHALLRALSQQQKQWEIA